MLDVSKTFYWSDTAVLGMAGPCRGAFKGLPPCRRPTTAKSKQLKNLIADWQTVHCGLEQWRYLEISPTGRKLLLTG